MTELEPEEALALTEAQRLVLASFDYEDDALTVKEIRKATKDKLSFATIRRALAKLCGMDLVERMPACKKGRGYSHLYQLKEE